MEIKGITIHNTGNSKSAIELYEELKKDNQLYLCHYLIDEKNTINTLDESVEARHTGKGYDFGNRYTLAIEICRSQSETEIYLKAQKRAISFIKKLMKKYNLTNQDIYFHIDFNQKTRCPHKILELYKTKEDFINEFKL